MRGQTVRVLVFIAMLAVLAADFSVGCGQGYVYGPVDQKFTASKEESDPSISVNNTPYQVPYDFWSRVDIGDIVKFDGRNWSIVKKASAPAPASPTPGSTTP